MPVVEATTGRWHTPVKIADHRNVAGLTLLLEPSAQPALQQAGIGLNPEEAALGA